MADLTKIREHYEDAGLAQRTFGNLLDRYESGTLEGGVLLSTTQKASLVTLAKAQASLLLDAAKKLKDEIGDGK